ncbi:MAG: CbiQ family ECF transporter T component [Sulfuritalea sp.]|nr:CbiQ family ECF transporter T component [Sulfuritalea sp.]MDP1983535.1 CbiQ family ECF transporter T component [Sulfuritalea sp.]
MKRPNSASLILLGLAALVAASSREGPTLFLACLGLGLVALIAATSHLRLLLRRSRWLLLTMLVMFGWLTPGTPQPLAPGASQEGLLLGAESLARLFIALSAVALILKALSPAELVAGMRSLLAPLALLGISRDRIAVRLALTLEEVEAAGNTDDAHGGVAATLTLPAPVYGAADILLGVLAGGLLLGAWLI